MIAEAGPGPGVLITRPRHQSAALDAAAAARGWHPVPFPVMEIVPVAETDVREQLEELHEPDITVFVSTNAVRFGIDYGGQGQLAAIGPATRAELEAAGRAVDIASATGFDSEHLLATAEFHAVDRKVVRIVRGRSGRELLADTLRERGATVEYLAVYDRAVPQPTEIELETLETLWTAGGIEAVVVMSVETLTNLVALLPERCVALLARTRLVTPASRVIKEARIRFPGIPVTLAEGPQADDIAAALAADGNNTSGHD